MPSRKIPVHDSITQLQVQVEQVRAAHPSRTRLPKPLWQSAVELARSHGIFAVSRALRLDYTRLKKQVNVVNGSSASSASEREGSQPSFVELIGAARARVDEYVIEFESGQGPKMRIHWKAATPPDWAGLLDAWRRAER
jgi:hypothetical protein